MRIGIVTYHFSDNYGALFQAYALRQWFILQGHHAEFINYQPDYVEGGGVFNLTRPISKDNLKILFLKLTGLKEHFFGKKFLKLGFENFKHDKLGVISERFSFSTELDDTLDNYDLLVCGSDQIWKPSEHYGVDQVYYLDFSSKSTLPRRISYAPSFGTDFLNTEFHQAVGAAIKKLDGISVRERSGCDIVKELIGIMPLCVPDPTLLLTDYKQIMEPYPVRPGKYVFSYILRSREVVGRVAEQLAARLDAELYSPHNPHRRWREIGQTVYPCPSQWLSLLNSAEFVVTNSFHGAALSIVLNKPFVVIGLQGEKSEFNARVKNLLALVGLESRFIQCVDLNTVDTLLEKIINWKEVNHNVERLRDTGAGYLLSEMAKV